MMPLNPKRPAKRIVMAHPAYDQCIKATTSLTLLDRAAFISVTERQAYMDAWRNPCQSLRLTRLSDTAAAGRKMRHER